MWQSADVVWQNQVCTWCGKTKAHTPWVSCRRRVPVYVSPRWVNDMDLGFMGSGLGVHGIGTGCTDGIAVSAMTVHVRPRPKLTTTVRTFEAQWNRQLFPATRNPSARTPAHAVIVPIRRKSLVLIVTRRRSRFDCVQNRQHNVEITHRPMHIAG